MTHPNDVRHVLVAHAANFNKTPRLTSEEGRRRAGAGLLTASGSEHLRQRRLLQPLFRRDVVALLDRTIDGATTRMLDRWETAARVDIAHEMTEVTKSIILGALFGDDLGAGERDALSKALAARRRFTELVYHGRLPFRTDLPTATVRAHERALQVIDTAIYDAIARRRAGATKGHDLISRLMDAAYPEGPTMTDRQVRDEVLTFMNTGYETLGDWLTWVWILLGRHPDADEELAAELSTVVGGRTPEASDIRELPFTGMVLAEALRLYPPTWLFARIPLEDDVLPVGGAVRRGSTLYVCPYVLHRHPRYFPEPEQFDPRRFAPGLRPPRYVYLPFGDGLHRCLGEHLANLEAVLVVAKVAQRFQLELLDGSGIQPYAGVTLRPRSAVWARPHRREQR